MPGSTRQLRAIVGASWIAAAAAAPSDAWALPITQYVTVQPIQVCNDAGALCADVNLQSSFVDKIYEQAGTGVIFLPTVKYDNSTFLTTRVDDLNPTRIDEWRELLRGPGHMQSSNSTTINMYFVEHLTDSAGNIAYRGISFVNANGVIVSEDALADTLAHELGHNLGLNHTTFGVTAGDALNLMTSPGRTSPTTPADVAPTGQLLDQLNQQQIDKIRQPLFSVDLINATATSAAQGQRFVIQLHGSNPTQFLKRLKVWYPAGAPVIDLRENADALIAAGCPAPAFTSSTTRLADGTEQVTYEFPDGCFFAASNVGFTFLPFDISQPEGSPDRFPDPFSFIFEFNDGSTAQAGFDELTRTASSTDPNAVLGFIGTPTDGPPADTLPPPTDFETPEAIIAAVPEPPSSLALLFGLALLAAGAHLRRRTTLRNADCKIS